MWTGWLLLFIAGSTTVIVRGWLGPTFCQRHHNDDCDKLNNNSNSSSSSSYYNDDDDDDNNNNKNSNRIVDTESRSWSGWLQKFDGNFRAQRCVYDKKISRRSTSSYRAMSQTLEKCVLSRNFEEKNLQKILYTDPDVDDFRNLLFFLV